MSNPIVIDISHYQPTPNWKAVKAGGTVGVILKATEGTGYKDPTFDSRWIAAQEAGLLVSAYHFLKHGKIADQMNYFQTVVEPAPGSRLVIDFEDGACTFDDLEQAADWLLKYSDCEVSVYGSNHLVDVVGGKTSDILERTSLWQARYSSNPPKVPTNIWPTWSLWQYTDKASVEGITGPVDGNKWNGDPAKLPGWFMRTDQPAPPVSDLPVVHLDIRIDTPDNVDLVITLNGKEVPT